MGENEFTKKLDENIGMLQRIFERDDTLVLRRFMGVDQRRFCVLFLEGMADSERIGETVITPLSFAVLPGALTECGQLADFVLCDETKAFEQVDEAVKMLLRGDTLALLDGVAGALACNTKGGSQRAVTEPDSERNLRGPRDGFTESIIVNLSLIRRRLQTPDLKCEMGNIGQRTNTRTCICYIESLVNEKILAELKRRLEKIDIDAVLESNYIEELVKDHPYSPYRTVGVTERPDIAASKLLEGRVLLLVDTTPMVLSVPYLFIENFQANDDYYLNFLYSSVARLLRLVSYLISILMPAIYIAAACYHNEMIPGTLLFNIAKSTEAIPFSSVTECVTMLLIFETLRETGARMSSKVGQALSIVGALVLGQAAVESGIVSNAVVIVVAISGITSLMIPRLKGAVMFVRFFFLGLAASLGLYGLFFGTAALFVHLISLDSFGVFYLEGFGAVEAQRLKDIYIRAPYWLMRLRPSFAKDPVRKGGKR